MTYLLGSDSFYVKIMEIEYNRQYISNYIMAIIS